MVRALLLPAAVILSLAPSVQGEVNCHELCNDVRGELNAGIACRQYRKTLPRPKVGNACRIGYQEAVTDACFAFCTGEEATNVVSQACRQYRAEMPKPVMFNSCETGYNAGFSEAKAKVAEKLNDAEQSPRSPPPEPKVVKVENKADAPKEAEPETSTPKVEEKVATKLRGEASKPAESAPETLAEEEGAPEAAAAAAAAPEAAEQQEEEEPAQPEADSAADKEVVATLPVNIDDHDVDLVIHRGQDPADAVKIFCAEHMADSGDACETQLLPHVLGKLEEKGMGND